MRLAPVERLGGLAEAAGQAVVDEGELEGAFEGFEGGLVVRWGLVCWWVGFLEKRKGRQRRTIWELPPAAGASAATSVVSGSSAGAGEVGSSPSDLLWVSYGLVPMCVIEIVLAVMGGRDGRAGTILTEGL